MSKYQFWLKLLSCHLWPNLLPPDLPSCCVHIPDGSNSKNFLWPHFDVQFPPEQIADVHRPAGDNDSNYEHKSIVRNVEHHRDYANSTACRTYERDGGAGEYGNSYASDEHGGNN